MARLITQTGPAGQWLAGLCPRCEKGRLFAGPVRLRECCSECRLDFSQFNVGDGPAAFLTLIVGALVVTLALWLQLGAEPAWWVHVLLWPPLTVLGVILGLRVAKAALLQSEYRNRAGGG